MTADLTIGNYELDDDSNGNLVIKDADDNIVLEYDDSTKNWKLGKAIDLQDNNLDAIGQLGDGSTGDVYDGTNIVADVNNTNTDTSNLGNDGSAISVDDNLDLQSSQSLNNVSSLDVDSLTHAGDRSLKFTGETTNSPGFGLWTQVDATRDAIVLVSCQAETDGTSDGRIVVDIDISGDNGPQDRSLEASKVSSAHSSGAQNATTTTVVVPAGGQYKVRNASDPNNANIIDEVNEVTL